jgi:hypothetical protein
MHDPLPTADPAFALWTLFRGLPRWFLARGCPPPLRDDRRWVCGLRASVLLGTLGLAASWASVFWLLIERRLFDVGLIGTILFTPGLWFGLFVMLPLSRWVGRGWLVSLLAVPVSTRVNYEVVRLANPHWELVAAWGGLGVGLWLCDPRRPRTLWTAAVAAIAGGLPYAAMNLLDRWDLDPNAGVPGGFEWVNGLVSMNLLFSPFQVLVAMALGVRLWWPPPKETAP